MRVEGLPRWLELVKSSYGSLGITFSGSKPDNIVRCSPVYENCSWIGELSLALDNENHTIRFQFPIPDTDNPYHRYDYFTIAVNDSVHLQFQGVQDSTFMGSFLNNNQRNEPDRWLMAKGAIMVRTSGSAPFNIANIELSAAYKDLITEYLGDDISQLSTNCDYYGIDFVDTTISEENIRVSNVKIAGVNTLIADSTYTISWTTEGKGQVSACSLFVSSTGEPPWNLIAVTPGDSESTSWYVPENSGSQCVFQVRAFGYQGQNSRAVSEVYNISRVSSFQLKATALNNSSARLQWDPQLLDTTGARYLLIAYKTKIPVLSFPDSNADTIHYNFQRRSDTINNLQTGILYHFASFIYSKAGAYIPAGPLGFDSVLIIDNTPPANNFELTSYCRYFTDSPYME